MNIDEHASPLPGNKLYQVRASKAFPILVRQATAQNIITYGDLAQEMGIPNPRTLNYPLGCIGNSLRMLSKAWGEPIPLINNLVVNKSTRLPGFGAHYLISEIEPLFSTMSVTQQRKIVDKLLIGIYSYPYEKWINVLDYFGLEPVQPYETPPKDDIVLRDKRMGSGESDAHDALKRYISQNPQVIALPKSTEDGALEYILPSGDIVDVMFQTRTRWTAVEVKSFISPISDIYRGLYQCIKYKAVLEAYLSETMPQADCRVVLTMQNEFPSELLGFKHANNIEVIDNIAIG